MKKGNIFIVSAASGTGKTTLVSRVLAKHPNIRVSVSHTTRAPRVGEIDGQHYHFVSQDEFMRLVGQGVFLEHAEIYGNYYGTSADALAQMCEQGIDVILEIDVQGAKQVRQALPEAVSIFILPPSLATLAGRLRGRNTDDESMIAKRLAQARHEIQQAWTFDYAVINNDLAQAEQDLITIIQAQHFLVKRQQEAIEILLKNS